MEKKQALEMYGSYYKIPRKFVGDMVASVSPEECLGDIEDYLGDSPSKKDPIRFVFRNEDDIEDYLRHLKFVERIKALRMSVFSNEGKNFLSKFIRSSDEEGRDAKYAKVRALLDKFIDELSIPDNANSGDAYNVIALGQKRSMQFSEKEILRSALEDVCNHFKVDFPVIPETSGVGITIREYHKDVKIPKKLSSKTAFLVSSEGTGEQVYEWDVVEVSLNFEKAVIEDGRIIRDRKNEEKWHTQYSYNLKDNNARKVMERPRSLPSSLIDMGDDLDTLFTNSKVWVAFKSSAAARAYIENQKATMNNSFDEALSMLDDSEKPTEELAKVVSLPAKEARTLQ